MIIMIIMMIMIIMIIMIINQGGPMTKEEAEAFEALPSFAALLAMRDWDDKAKVEN